MANRAQIIITVDAAGQLAVTAPFQDKLTCYALLEAARDVVKEQSDALAGSKIVPVNPGDVPRLTLRGG